MSVIYQKEIMKIFEYNKDGGINIQHSPSSEKIFQMMDLELKYLMNSNKNYTYVDSIRYSTIHMFFKEFDDYKQDIIVYIKLWIKGLEYKCISLTFYKKMYYHFENYYLESNPELFV